MCEGVFLVLLCGQSNMGRMGTRLEGLWFWYCVCEHSNFGQVETRCEGLVFWYCFVTKAIWAKWKQDVRGCGSGIVL